MLVGWMEAVEGKVGGLSVVKERVKGGDDWRTEKMAEWKGGRAVEGCVDYYSNYCCQQSRESEGE